MIIANKSEISQMRVGNDEIGILVKKGEEINLRQNLNKYSFDNCPSIKGKTLRNVPVDLCYTYEVDSSDDYDNKYLDNDYNYSFSIKHSTGGDLKPEDNPSKEKIQNYELSSNQKRNIIDIYPKVGDRHLRRVLLDYNTVYTYFINNEPTSTKIKTKKEKRFKQDEVIYINNYLTTSKEFEKTDFCTLQQCFKEMTNLEGTYTIELAKTGIPYVGPFYYTGKANIIIKGNGQTLLGENCGVLNNDEHQRSIFEWAGSGTITFQNVILQNQASREEYGENNVAGETFGMTSGNVIAINSTFLGYQDTVRLVGNGYFEKCTIAGDVDFIWAESGFNAALFQSCTINCLADDKRGSLNTCIVAPRMSKTPLVGKGIVLKDCNINIDDGVKTYLGRNPWASYTDWYNNAAFINCNINSTTTNSSSTCVYGNTWFRTSRWKNAASSPTGSKYIGFKDYGLTLNGKEFTTKIIKKTTKYDDTLRITSTEKTKNYNYRTYDFTIYFTASRSVDSRWVDNVYARRLNYDVSKIDYDSTSRPDELSFNEVDHYFEFAVGFPDLNRTDLDVSQSASSFWKEPNNQSKLYVISNFIGKAYHVGELVSALNTAFSVFNANFSCYYPNSKRILSIGDNWVIPNTVYAWNESEGTIYNYFTGKLEYVGNTKITTPDSLKVLNSRLKSLCPFGRLSSDKFSGCNIASGQASWDSLFNGASCKYGLTPRSCRYISAKNMVNYGCPLYAAVASCTRHGNSCVWNNMGIYTTIKDEYGNIISKRSTKNGGVPSLSSDDKSALVYGIIQNGKTFSLKEYADTVKSLESPVLIIKRKRVSNDEVLKTKIIPLTSSSKTYSAYFAYTTTFTEEGEPVVAVMTDDLDDPDEIIGYRPYNGEVPKDEDSTFRLSKKTDYETYSNPTSKVDYKYETEVVRHKTVHYELIENRMDNCPELSSIDVSAEYAGANNILNRVFDIEHKKFITSPDKWTEYQKYMTIPDSSTCGSDNSAITFIFGSNAISNTFEYNTENVKGTISNKSGAVLNVDCSSGGKVTSVGRNTDIQFNKGAKLTFNGPGACKIYAICYPGYGNIKISALGKSASGECPSLALSRGSTVTIESLNDTSYLQAIYIIKD